MINEIIKLCKFLYKLSCLVTVMFKLLFLILHSGNTLLFQNWVKLWKLCTYKWSTHKGTNDSRHPSKSWASSQSGTADFRREQLRSVEVYHRICTSEKHSSREHQCQNHSITKLYNNTTSKCKIVNCSVALRNI